MSSNGAYYHALSCPRCGVRCAAIDGGSIKAARQRAQDRLSRHLSGCKARELKGAVQ